MLSSDGTPFSTCSFGQPMILIFCNCCNMALAGGEGPRQLGVAKASLTVLGRRPGADQRNFPGYARRVPNLLLIVDSAQAGVSGITSGGRLISKLIKQTILPKCAQVLKRGRSRSAQARQHGPCAAGRRPTDDVSARTGGDSPRRRRAPEGGGQRPGGDLRMMPPPGRAEILQGNGAPLKAEASGENHGLCRQGVFERLGAETGR